ncbi:MAG TPA: YciI family protein [Myxococcota bacterium]|nr:YciI family protein [Myxococcota bacterium]
MRVMVMVKASAESEAGVLPDEALIAAMGKFNEDLIKAGVLIDAAGLQSSAKGARVRFAGDRRIVSDGPFAETKELVAGYWVWEVKSLADALDWAKRCPNPHNGAEAELEIRPMFGPEDFPDSTPEIVAQEKKKFASQQKRPRKRR